MSADTDGEDVVDAMAGLCGWMSARALDSADRTIGIQHLEKVVNAVGRAVIGAAEAGNSRALIRAVEAACLVRGYTPPARYSKESS